MSVGIFPANAATVYPDAFKGAHLIGRRPNTHKWKKLFQNTQQTAPRLIS